MGKVQIHTDAEHSPLPIRMSADLGSFSLASRIVGTNDAAQLEAKLGLFTFAAGVLQHEDAVSLSLPRVVSQAGVQWSEGEAELAVKLNASLDVQELAIVMRSETVPALFVEGLKFAQVWGKKLAYSPPVDAASASAETKELNDELRDSIEYEDSQQGGKGIQEKKLFSRDPLLAQTDALFHRKRLPSLIEEQDLLASTDGDVLEDEINTVHQATDTVQQPNSEDRLPMLQEEIVEEEFSIVPLVHLSWKVKLKLSKSISFDLTGKESKSLFSVSGDTIWVEGRQNHGDEQTDPAGPYLLGEVGLKGFQITITKDLESIRSKNHWQLFSLGYGSAKLSVASPPNGSEVHENGQLSGVHLTLKQLEVGVNPASINSIINVGGYALNQVSQILQSISHFELRHSHPEKSRKKKKPMLGKVSWKLSLQTIGAKYSTELIPLENFSTTKQGVPYTLAVSCGEINSEPWEHWSGGQATAKSIKVHFYSGTPTGSDYSTLLWLESLQAKMEERGGALGMQIIANQGKVDANIDMALFMIQILTDAGGFKREFMNLTQEGRALRSTSTKSRPAHSLPSEPGKLKRPLQFNICVQNFNIGMKVGEMDSISCTLLEAHADTRTSIPRVYVKQVKICMNDSQLVNCKGVNLTVTPVATLQAMEEQSSNNIRLRRCTVVRSRDREFAENKLAVTVDNLGESLPEVSPLSTRVSGGANPSLDPFVNTKFSEDVSGDISLASTFGSRDSIEEATEQTGSGSGSLRDSMSMARRRQALEALGILPSAEENEEDPLGIDILAVELEMDTVCVGLPHDQHFGRLVMFLELWLEAVKEV